MDIKFLFYLLCVANLVNVLHLGLYVVGANIYDIKKFRERSIDINTPGKLVHKPLVSIVIPAHNESIAIERTLNSVLASTYQHIEVIVIDDGSVDDTAQVVRNYIKRLPLFRTRSYINRYSRSFKLRRRYVRAEVGRKRMILVSQENKGKGMAMNNAIENYVRGKFVMCIDADSILAPTAIEKAVAYFDDPKVIGVAANVKVMDSNSILGIVQRFEHMIGYRSKKFYTLTNSEFIVGGVASTYRTKNIKAVKFYDTDTQTEDIGLSMKLIASNGNRNSKIVYASDVVASTEGVHTFKALVKQRYRWKLGCLQNLIKYRYIMGSQDKTKYSWMLSFYRLPMAFFSEILLLLEPVILSYVVYLCIKYHAWGIMIGAYMTITAYVLLTLWPDEHLTNKEKMKMSAQALIIYVLMYIMDIVQIAAIVRCMFNFKAVLKRNTATTWNSPERLLTADAAA